MTKQHLGRIVVAFALVVLAAGIAWPARAQETAAPPPIPFADWLAGLRQEAIARGIGEKTLDAALDGVEPVPVVVERDRTQAEQTLTIDDYLKQHVSRKTVKTARQMAWRHRVILRKVAARYGVPANVIVAVWGIESNFGRFSGVRPTIASLVTLSYDNRRAALFREELLSALQALDRGDIELAKMKGSWAGAMGQPQFMPSSYLKYAEDFDRDGVRDIWGSLADVFASIANFLKQNGWTTGERWGVAVSLPKQGAGEIEQAAPLRETGCQALKEMTEGLTLARWRALGVRPLRRAGLPKPSTVASLVRAGSRDFLVFNNYAVLLQYNCATSYALAVGTLADSVR